MSVSKSSYKEKFKGGFPAREGGGGGGGTPGKFEQKCATEAFKPKTCVFKTKIVHFAPLFKKRESSLNDPDSFVSHLELN